MSAKTVIDADGLILGRMASIVARRLLAGETIELVNAQGAVISGKKVNIINEHKEFISVGGHRKGPIHFRMPNAIVRRTIRGMLPYRKPTGRDAYKRLTVHIGVPEELEGAERQSIAEAHVGRLNHRYVTVGDVAEQIGWQRRGV
jgi:large subunit ribosomal protein L13